MKSEPLRQKLIAAARMAEPPSDRVPFAFEKRVMTRLAAREFVDSWAALGALLWRAVIPCFALTIVIVGASSLAVSSRPDDLGTQLDAVLLADLDTSAESP